MSRFPSPMMSARSFRARLAMTVACVGVLLASAAPAQLQLPHFLNVDVPTASVDGSFLLNGVPFTAVYGDLGLLHLIHPGDDVPITIGATVDQTYGPLMVISGDYAPAYEFVFSSGEIPVNPTTVVGAFVPLSSTSTLDVHVAAIDVSFDFTLNGGAFSVNASQSGAILLRDVVSGLEFPIGTTSNLPIVVKIIPGTYDIVYSHLSGSIVPQNQHAVVEPARSILKSQTVTTDITTSDRGLTFELNGAPFPGSGYADGEIFLRNFSTGDSVSYGLTSDGPGAIRRVVSGTYDVTWTVDSASSLVPINSNAVVVEGLIIDTPGLSVSDVDVQAASITLDATLNGGAFSTSAYEHAEIVLVGPHGDEVKLAETDDESPDPVLVVIGSYDLHYRWLRGNLVTPRNPDARLATNLQISQDDTLSIDVPSVEITPAFTLDGGAFPGSAYESADFTLEGELEGDVIPLGSTDESPSGVQLIPGAYDVVYDWNAGSTVVPRNRNHTVRLDVDLASSQTLDIDIPTKVILPSFLLDGVAFPNAPGERGDFVLRSIAGGELDVGPSNAAVPETVRGIQGVYSVEYDWMSGVGVPRNVGHHLDYTNVPESDLATGLVVGSLMLFGVASRRRHPPLRHARLAALILVAVTLTPLTAFAQVVALTVDVPAISAQGDLLLNGLPTSPDAGELASLGFASLEGSQFAIGLSNAQVWGPIWVIPGAYQPTYEYFFSSGDLPINPAATIGPPLAVEGLGSVDVDIPSVEISFEFRQNGIAFPAAAGEVANFLLRHTVTGEEFIIGNSSVGSAVVSIVPGTYDVVYAYVSGTQIAQNTHAIVVADADLSFSQPLIVDVPVFSHIVSTTLNAAPFPISPLESGEIHLRNLESGDSVSFGFTHVGSGPRPIIPGTYDATYSRVTGGPVAPSNANAVIAIGLSISPPPMPGQLSLTQIDVHSFAVTLDATLDGNPFVASPLETAHIVLVTDRGDEVDLGPTHLTPSTTLQVIGGRYDVYYRNQAGYTAVPANPNAKIADNVRVNASQPLSIDVTSISVDFDFQLNGQPFPMSVLERGDFTLVGASEGDVIPLGSTHLATPTRRVVAGPYDLIYDWKAGSVFAPRNVGHHALQAEDLLTDQTVVANLQTSSILPTFELNSAAFPIDPGQRGRIVLRDFHGGTVDLGRTDIAVPASVLAIDDYYAIDYHWETGVDVPRNTREPLGMVVVPEPSTTSGIIVGFSSLLVANRKRRSQFAVGANRRRRSDEDEWVPASRGLPPHPDR